MFKSSKKPENIVEELHLGIEEAITIFISWVIAKLELVIKEIFRKKDLSKVDISFISRKEKFKQSDSFAFSLINQCDVTLDSVDFNRNTVVCGSTGAGKNVTLDGIIENRLDANLPVVMIDLKGDNQALLKFYELNKARNRKCYIFSETYPLSDRCNPILEGPASTIVNRLFAIFDWGEPYYADTNYVALEKAVHFLKREGHPISIRAIFTYLDSNLKNKETQNLINKLSKIDKSAFGNLLSAEEDAVTFSKIRQEKASVYIGLSTLGYPEISQAIGKLFIYELMYHAYETFSNFKVQSSPFSVVIDELGSAVTEDFISLINKCRGAGIGICVSFQLLSDLDHVSNTFRDRLIGNMNNFFIGHCHVEKEAEYWSKMIGTKQTRKLTTQTENELEQARGSVREVEEFLVHPNIFKNLKVGQFVIKSFFPSDYLDLVKVHLKVTNNSIKQINIKPQDNNFSTQAEMRSNSDPMVLAKQKKKGWIRNADA